MRVAFVNMPPVNDSLMCRHFFHQIQKLLSITIRVVAFCILPPIINLLVAGVTHIRRVTQAHTKSGYSGGKLKVVAGLSCQLILHHFFYQSTLVFFGAFVTQLNGYQLIICQSGTIYLRFADF